MTNQTFPPINERLNLKEPTGWFAAGNAFRRALALLSDGAFRLFAHICLEADRRTGRLQATHKELAAVLGKSKRAIGTYVAELESKGVCLLKPGKNQFSGTVFEISDSYWPYHRVDNDSDSLDQKVYVKSIRECFLSLGCASNNFSSADVAAARELHQRGIPLAVIEEAMLVGACRKYSSWLQGQSLKPIRSMTYFSSLIAEIQEKPLPPGYSAYLRTKVKQLTVAWNEAMKSTDAALKGGYPDMASQEIVQ
jgi:hypothetical protein